MPNSPSTFRGYFRFKAGEKPTEPNLNAGFVDKLDIDINSLFISVASNSAAIGNPSLLSGTTLVDRINAISDSSGNLTKSSPEFPIVASGASLLKTSNSQFKILGQNAASKFRVNGKIKITQASSAQIIAVVAGITFSSPDTIIDLNTNGEYPLITEASITQVFNSHELDSDPVVNGATGILKESITADRLAPGVGASSMFTSDIFVTKSNAGLYLVGTTGSPLLNMWSQTATVANRRRIRWEMPTDNTLRLNRVTDADAFVDSLLTVDLVGGNFDFPILPTSSVSPTFSSQLVNKTYADLKLSLTGGSLSGALTLASDPSTNLGAATKRYVDVGGFGTATGTNTYAVTFSPSGPIIVGKPYIVFFPNANTLPNPTLNANGTGAKALLRNNASPIAAGDINGVDYYILISDGTAWRMIWLFTSQIGRISSANFQTGANGTIANTLETDLFTYQLPANTLSTLGVRVTAIVRSPNANTNSKTFRLYFGSQVGLMYNTVLPNIGFNGVKLEYIVRRTGSSTQDIRGTNPIGSISGVTFSSQTQTYTALPVAGTQTETAAITIKVTGQNGAAVANDCVATSFLVELIG